MKTLTAFLAVNLVVPCLGFAGITIESPSNERREVASPMMVTASIDTSLPKMQIPFTKPLFETRDLANTYCDSVTLKSVQAYVTFNENRTKGEFSVIVVTYTEPPQDKKAVVTIRLQNDDEALVFPTAEYPGRSSLGMKINAEETKTRSKSKTARFDPEQLDRILAGQNPRIQPTLEVRDN
jgi:hypothetical protein